MLAKYLINLKNIILPMQLNTAIELNNNICLFIEKYTNKFPNKLIENNTEIDVFDLFKLFDYDEIINRKSELDTLIDNIFNNNSIGIQDTNYIDTKQLDNMKHDINNYIAGNPSHTVQPPILHSNKCDYFTKHINDDNIEKQMIDEIKLLKNIILSNKIYINSFSGSYIGIEQSIDKTVEQINNISSDTSTHTSRLYNLVLKYKNKTIQKGEFIEQYNDVLCDNMNLAIKYNIPIHHFNSKCDKLSILPFNNYLIGENFDIMTKLNIMGNMISNNNGKNIVDMKQDVKHINNYKAMYELYYEHYKTCKSKLYYDLFLYLVLMDNLYDKKNNIYQYFNKAILTKYNRILNRIINDSNKNEYIKQYHAMLIVLLYDFTKHIINKINDNDIINIKLCDKRVAYGFMMFNYFYPLLDKYEALH